MEFGNARLLHEPSTSTSRKGIRSTRQRSAPEYFTPPEKKKQCRIIRKSTPTPNAN